MAVTNIITCDYSNPTHRQAIAGLINAYIDDEIGGVLVGLLTAFENFSTFTAQPMINIHDVFVLQDYRGKGIGRQLMQALIQEAGNRKSSRISLEVRKDNPEAQNLYKSLDFEETDPSMFYWRKYL
jgi:ribosomal protein S18 acetylase RimI-like enzyme